MSACSFSILTLNLVLTHTLFLPSSKAASIYFCQHLTPSGQSRVYRVTQLRTDCVHCRESVGTGPVVLKVVRVTGAAFASPRTKYYCAPLFSHTHYWYTVCMFKLSGVYQNISTAVVLYCFVESVVYTCKKFSAHGTVSIFKLSGVYQNISTAVVLYCFVEPFFPADL